MKIVLDTNVLISALLWSGTPYQLLQSIRLQGTAQLYSSQALIEELAEVLTRDTATRRLQRIGKSAQQLISDYIEAIELVEPTETVSVVRDPKDDKVLACALTARADLIVSGDRDLLTLGTFRGIRIVSPSAALGELSGQAAE